MDNNSHILLSQLASSTPYDLIDTNWIDQRLKDHPTVRRSKLAAYFEGFMEFTTEPPSISRSPSPEVQRNPIWKKNRFSTGYGPSTNGLRGMENSRKHARGIPTRQSTTESDSDPGYAQKSRKRRHLTPVPQHVLNHHRPIVDTRKRKQLSPRATTTRSGSLNSHKMETRSKSRRKGCVGYSGVSKIRTQRRKIP
ncbi:hypothetical protein BGZ60DRAFT_272910 [Tricladium varicosporioides]|nr:hypothetical protein BGZ60DRAFT_272910 [Hymenoscyphus varicosporioides]